MRSLATRDARFRDVGKRILTPWSEEFSFGVLLRTASIQNTGAWQSANDPIALPFRLSQPAILTEFWVGHGTSAGGNLDIGVYDAALNKVIAAGSTAASGFVQYVNVTDTPLDAGKVYYLATVRDNITANRVRNITAGASIHALNLYGCLDSTTDQFPLGATLTAGAVATFTTIPLCGMAFRLHFS